MSDTLKFVRENALFTGWDFSTGAVKCLAFDLNGNVLAEARFPTDLWMGSGEEEGAIELNLLQLEGQARQTTRSIAAQLRAQNRLEDWTAGGISATHHTAGRIDSSGTQIRRAICWNDQTLTKYHAIGVERLGGMEVVERLIGAPWAIRYTLSHLVKDELRLSQEDWSRTRRILPHGSLAAGFLTGNFDSISVSAAASTGILDFRTRTWCRDMLSALESEAYRALAWEQLPPIYDANCPVGELSSDAYGFYGSIPRVRIYPTSDDQQAGLVGGGAVEDGQVAIVLGNSAVVNSSCAKIPNRDINLDVMALNWGPFLLMRCYSNGAFFIDRVCGSNLDYAQIEQAARRYAPGAGGARILPFLVSEPSLGVLKPSLEWRGSAPQDDGAKYRACLEALAFLIALGVEEHKKAGQKIRSISVSGGVARSDLMCEILASVLNFPLIRLESEEGPALGAAVTSLAAEENFWRAKNAPNGEFEPYSVESAVRKMVKFKRTVAPNEQWVPQYRSLLSAFCADIEKIGSD
ncbi:MAG: FGGY-family carbohydrate kinase [Planctomycetia bacterium]|nr:FGGY-family carbohydrate kinase [Planctomycetia bacterium]